jgi:hypothetical protein
LPAFSFFVEGFRVTDGGFFLELLPLRRAVAADLFFFLRSMGEKHSISMKIVSEHEHFFGARFHANLLPQILTHFQQFGEKECGKQYGVMTQRCTRRMFLRFAPIQVRR